MKDTSNRRSKFQERSKGIRTPVPLVAISKLSRTAKVIPSTKKSIETKQKKAKEETEDKPLKTKLLDGNKRKSTSLKVPVVVSRQPGIAKKLKCSEICKEKKQKVI